MSIDHTDVQPPTVSPRPHAKKLALRTWGEYSNELDGTMAAWPTIPDTADELISEWHSSVEQPYRVVVPSVRKLDVALSYRPIIDVEATFELCADQVEMETGHLSAVSDVVMHRAYQRIIGLGPGVLPFLLRRIRHDSGHWFWALVAIAGEDPAEDCVSSAAATKRWLEWGRQRGWID